MNRGWRFWLITALALLSAAGTLALGRWQLSRAAQKLAIQASMDAKAALSILDGRSLAGGADPSLELHRRVALRGEWISDRTVFLDNRPMNGRTGLYVVTPMRLQDSAAVVLVQRGWVARDFLDRSRLPTIETPAGVREIVGHIAPPPAKLYELGGPDAGLIRQNMDLAHFAAETGLALLPVSVQQTDAASDGLLRDWPRPSVGVEKHYGYAFQWFALSGLIAILYVWFQIVRRFIYPRRA
ncbi:SURF1 family protein [Rhodoferax sp.]|uniref:SURF1 family protein n=1 Tax=Rhodoferax sp. TaxID=50421 RepID=UPI0025FDBAE9|nr:SURF1 family protein [Rhodoferax sp.]